MDDDWNSMTIDKLPDDILLEIFGKLFFEDLCHCSQVSRRCHRLAQSFCYKEISIDKHLKNPKLCLLIDHPFITEHLESFEYLNNHDFFITFLDSTLFSKLRAKCSRMKKLVLTKCSISTVTLSDLPPALKHLSLWGCKINPDELFGNHADEQDITCLDFSGVTTCFTSENLNLLLRLKNLHCLYLEGCFRINNGGIELIIDILPRLQVLDLEGTDISNEIVRTILHHGSHLKELYLGHTCIDDNAFTNIAVCNKTNLSMLCLRNTQITKPCIDQLVLAFNNQVHILSSSKLCPFSNHPCTLSRLRKLLHVLPSSKKNYNERCNHYLSHICPA